MVWRVCNLGNTWKQNMTCTAMRRQDWAYHSFVLFDDGHIADSWLDATCPNPHLGWCIKHKKRKKQELIIKSFKRHQGAMPHNDTILDKKVSGSAKLLRVLWASQRGLRLLKDAQKSVGKGFTVPNTWQEWCYHWSWKLFGGDGASTRYTTEEHDKWYINDMRH